MDKNTASRKKRNFHKRSSLCSAKNCNNQRNITRQRFFRFPKEKNRAMKWAIACNREDLLQKLDNLYNSHSLCGAHFELSMFANDNCKRLQSDAVPTLFPFLEGSSYIPFEHNYSTFSQPTPHHMKQSTILSDNATVHKIMDSMVQEETIPVDKPLTIFCAADFTFPLKSSALTQPDHEIVVPEESTPIDIPLTIRCSPDLTCPEAFTDPDFNITDDLEELSSDVLITKSSTQTQTSMSLSAHSPRKEKLRATLKVLRNENMRLKRKNEELKAKFEKIEEFIALDQYKSLLDFDIPSRVQDSGISKLSRHESSQEIDDIL